MDDYEQSSRNIRWGVVLSYITMAANIVVSLVYTPILTGSLGQQQYGLYSIGQSIVGYLSLSELGFGNAIVRYITKYRVEGNKHKISALYSFFIRIYSMMAGFILIVGLAIAFLSNRIFTVSTGARGYRELRIIIIIMVINLAISFALTPFSAIITSYERFSFIKLSNLVYILLKPLVMIPLLLFGYKAIALSVVTLILNFLLQIANVVYVHQILKIKISYHNVGIESGIIKEILQYAFYIFLTTVVSQLNDNSDKTILGIISGEAAVSVYSIGYLINTYMQSISMGIAGVQFPRTIRLVAEAKSMKELSDRMIKIGRLQLYMGVLVASGFICFGKEFIDLWVGKDYALAFYIALAISLPSMIPNIQTTPVDIIQAMNKNKFRAIVLVVCAVLNVITSVPIGIKFGALGCAACTGATILITKGIVLNWYYKRKIQLDIGRFWRTILRQFIKIFPVFAVGVALNFGLQGYNWLYLTLKIVIYTVLFCLYLYGICMNQYEKAIFKDIIVKYIRRKNDSKNM